MTSRLPPARAITDRDEDRVPGGPAEPIDDDFDDEAPTNPPRAFVIPDPDAEEPLALGTAEMQFLDEIRRTPDDFALRVVYADWLEQQGDLPKAEIVRLLSVSPREGSPEHARLTALAELEPNNWIAILSRGPIDGCEQQLRRACSQRWETLASTDEPRVRQCGECRSAVTFCASLEGIHHHSHDPMERLAYSPLVDEARAKHAFDAGMIMGPQQWRVRNPLRLKR